MASDIELSIIIPVFNERDNVENLFNEIQSALPAQDYNFEVIFVDDGSNDGTRQILSELKAQHDRLEVVYHKSNYGQSAALLSGAKTAKFPILVTMDGDGQNDPADIPRLYRELYAKNLVVLGNRKKRDDNFLKRLSSRVGNGIRKRLLNDECPDTGCSLKMFSKDAFLSLPHFNHMHRFLPALFIRAGYQIVNVKVNHRPRLHGDSKYGVFNRLFVGIHDLIGMRWLLRRPCSPEVVE